MNDKVNVSIREIDNGYIFDRSWQEGKGKDAQYCNEQHFMPELPGDLKFLFKKGYIKDNKKNKYERMADDMTPKEKDENEPKQSKNQEKSEEEDKPKTKFKGFYGKRK